jgi:hypothetical protein
MSLGSSEAQVMSATTTGDTNTPTMVRLYCQVRMRYESTAIHASRDAYSNMFVIGA